MYKIRILFSKNDEAAYISHLDLMKTLQRSFCRAKLPVKYSEGFNPHICMSILSPLSTGYRSEYELCDLELICDSMPNGVTEVLNKALPGGIQIKKVYPAAQGLAVAQIAFSEFSIFMEGGEAAKLTDVFQEPLFFEKKSKRGSKQVNILDYIQRISFENVENGALCNCILSAGEDPLNPSYIVGVLREKGLLQENGTVRYTRIAILSADLQLFN